jgi:hypothetical protein
MRYTILFLFFSAHLSAQNNTFATAGIAYTVGAPTFVPGARGTMIAVDTITGLWYYSTNRNTASWTAMGDRVQRISGCTAPVYTPEKYQSQIVLNACALPEMYAHVGAGVWVCLNCAASGATNLSFTQLTDSTFQLNSSTGNDVVFKSGANQSFSLTGSTLTIASTGGGGGGGSVVTDATLDGDGTGGNPLGIAQQGAVEPQVLTWTGATWEPSWGNPYVFVTSGATIDTDVNEILIGTLSANATFGLPTCNAANDGKRFKFVRNGGDAFAVIIDPAGGQTFYDGSAVKIIYGQLSIDCTCKHGGGSVWFFDNN